MKLGSVCVQYGVEAVAKWNWRLNLYQTHSSTFKSQTHIEHQLFNIRRIMKYIGHGTDVIRGQLSSVDVFDESSDMIQHVTNVRVSEGCL